MLGSNPKVGVRKQKHDLDEHVEKSYKKKNNNFGQESKGGEEASFALHGLMYSLVV